MARHWTDLSGQVALVSGGSRGLGLEITEGPAEAGAAVVVTGRREPWLSEAKAALAATDAPCDAIACDATDLEQVRRFTLWRKPHDCMITA